MLGNIKPLIYVLVAAFPGLYLGGRIATPPFAPREYAFLRNAFIFATAAAFLFNNFFIFAAVMTLFCVYSLASRAASPELFLVLLLAVPLVNLNVGGFGIVNQLAEVNNGRVLAGVLLLPLLFTARKFGRREIGTFTLPDKLLIGYVLLTIALASREGGATNILRIATLQGLDVLLPYFIISRRVTTLADFQKICMALVIVSVALSMIAVLELVKKWQLYAVITNEWGRIKFFAGAGVDIRGSASANSPIVYGFVVMTAIGCMLAVQHLIRVKNFKLMTWGILGLGLAACLSRGPWVGAVILAMAYIATGKSSFAVLAKFGLAGILALLLLVTVMPNAIKLSDILPLSSMRADTVDYRQRLLEQAVAVIGRNPLFGSTDYWTSPELLEMVQGQGIIDIVNHYLKVALDSGLVGLALFVGFFLAILAGLQRTLKLNAAPDSEINVSARAVRATLIAILMTIATVSAIDYVPYIFWSVGGLCVALVRIAYRERTAMARTAVARQVPAEAR